jgi:quinol---cytochrome c reductase iron-sulfur subunit, bacillus type
MKGRDEDSVEMWRKKFSTPELPSSERRSFLGALVALGSFCVGALLSVPLIRFTLFPLLRRTTELEASPVGALSDFSSLSEPIARTVQVEQVDGWRKAVSEKTVYVTKDGHGHLCVLSSICPHLGCTVPWVSDRKEFVCPCHGGTFAPDGSRISGPPLRGMDSLETVNRDGQLLVRFQYFRQLVADKEVVG